MVKRGQEAREARLEEEGKPLTFMGIMIRFLPVWALLVMIIVLAPSLPGQIARAAVGWVREIVTAPDDALTAEPVFIIEGGGVAPEDDLPPPDWPLEISPIFTPEVQYWEEDIARWSLEYRVKPNLIATLMQIESCGDPTVTSAAGAVGLFQVMPFHFEEGEDAYQPDTNARRGIQFFAEMLAAANGDVGLAFAAYNGGQGVLYSSPAEWPDETQYYQFWGSGIYEEAEQALTQSPTLIQWLDSGGAALCSRAANSLGLGRRD
ncbi:MAG: hypothetical protein Kow00124_00570 [Anaerolineae bacterium]